MDAVTSKQVEENKNSKEMIVVMIELEPPPCMHWSVDFSDGLQPHEVRLTRDAMRQQDVFSCTCGSKYTWSPGPDFDQPPCRHLVALCRTLDWQIRERDRNQDHG